MPGKFPLVLLMRQYALSLNFDQEFQRNVQRIVEDLIHFRCSLFCLPKSIGCSV